MAETPTLDEHLFAADTKRILSLDGGGVRGIITIAFLERIEAVLKERSGRGSEFRLSDYFDLVGGTSVGSILATLIALGYPVAEIKKIFREWCPSIFHRPLLGIPFISPRFSSGGLKRRARKILQDATLETAPLKTGLAIVTKRVDTGSPWVLTNNPNAKYWKDPEDGSYLGNRNYRLSDLVRASTAAPYYFAPKRIPISKVRGLFVDGGVSPYNNPALLMFMLAGIRGYGFQWHLGADHLLIVSVGTGGFRTVFEPGPLTRNFSTLFAAQALRGLIGDTEALSLTLLQWLSAPERSWEINSEIGNLEGELMGSGLSGSEPKPLLSFIRYDARLEKDWLHSACGSEIAARLSAGYIADLQRLDRPDMMDEMYRVGEHAAKAQVTPNDFPARFDRVSA